MPYPDFVYIGAPRAGSTWLWRFLQCHPGIWVPPCKSVAYFHPRFQRARLKKYIRYWRGRFSLQDWQTRRWFRRFFYTPFPGDNWYQCLFPDDAITGEIAEAYSSLDEEDIARIAQRMPNVRIIMTLRNPVERAISHAVHGRATRRGRNVIDVPDAELIAHIDDPDNEARTCYTAMLDRWLAHFPREQILINFYEQLCESPSAYMRGICEFLGVSDFPAEQEQGMQQRVNAGGLENISDRVYRHAAAKYADEVRALADRLGGAAIRWDDENRK